MKMRDLLIPCVYLNIIVGREVEEAFVYLIASRKENTAIFDRTHKVPQLYSRNIFPLI
jgi:hypothetical protein